MMSEQSALVIDQPHTYCHSSELYEGRKSTWLLKLLLRISDNFTLKISIAEIREKINVVTETIDEDIR